PDPVAFVIDDHVDDLVQVDRDGPVLGGQVVPAVRAKRVTEVGELPRCDAGGERLAAEEADADLQGTLLSHGRAPRARSARPRSVTVSRWTSGIASVSRYIASVESMSSTATPTWSIAASIRGAV